jgi:hypothetical protein
MYLPGELVRAKCDMGDALFVGEIYTVKECFCETGIEFLCLEELGDNSMCYSEDFHAVALGTAITSATPLQKWLRKRRARVPRRSRPR